MSDLLAPDYAAFLAGKAPKPHAVGIEAGDMPSHLFDYQRDCVAFALRQGRAAMFLDCLGAESSIRTESGERTIGELMDLGRPSRVWAMDGRGGFTLAAATQPFRKGHAALYRVETKTGRTIVATRGHRLLTARGWIAVGDMHVGDWLAGYAPVLPASTSEPAPSGSLPGGPHCGQKPADLMGRCSLYCRRCDPRLRPAEGGGQSSVLQQADVRERALPWSHMGVLAQIPAHSRRHQDTDHPSTPGFAHLDWSVSGGLECQPHSFGSAPFARYIHSGAQVPSGAIPALSVCGLLQSEPGLCEGAISFSVDAVVSIHYLRFGEYFDIHVPGAEHYLGDGLISHNTGLGKSAVALEWCRQAGEASNGRSLILTPLAVARQFEAEARRFGYTARVIREASDAGDGINICNYDRLDKIDPETFGAVALDESSILKDLTGATTRALIAAFAGHRFKLCCTATPAPNDHMELGTHAEFLGVMQSNEMLSRWFINDTATASQSWRLKGHAQDAFWDWVSSWARCAETPADLGYDASRFVLPPLTVHRHKAAGDTRKPSGVLFAEDMSATTMHAIKRETATARAEAVAALIDAEPGEAWVVWCDNDAEADALKAAITGAADVRGSMSADAKETALDAFHTGELRYIVTKPSIAGRGLNWQHAARMAFVGRSFSYEAWYQAVRRCWRFGQMRPVEVHLIVAEGEEQIGRVIDRKAEGHATMKRAMSAAMRRNRETVAVTKVPYVPTHITGIPSWMFAA